MMKKTQEMEILADADELYQIGSSDTTGRLGAHKRKVTRGWAWFIVSGHFRSGHDGIQRLLSEIQTKRVS